MSEVQGARRLQRLLRSLPDDVSGPVKVAIRESAEVVQADWAKRAAPLSQRMAHAALSKAAIGKSNNGFGARVGFRTKAMRELAWFAHLIEFGTRPHSLSKGATLRRRRSGLKPGAMHPGTPARPTLGPALRANRRWILKRIRKAVRQALWRGGGGGGDG